MIGVGRSPGTLAMGRAKVPDGEFHEADLHQLPVPDDQVDVVVCGRTHGHQRHLPRQTLHHHLALRTHRLLTRSEIRSGLAAVATTTTRLTHQGFGSGRN